MTRRFSTIACTRCGKRPMEPVTALCKPCRAATRRKLAKLMANAKEEKKS